MKNRDFIKNKIKRYKELKADIKYREHKLEEIEENIIGITAMPSGEKTGATYKVTSQTEIQAIKYAEDTTEIRREIRELKREVQKIENAMSILNDKEKEIIQAIYIDNKSRAVTLENLIKKHWLLSGILLITLIAVVISIVLNKIKKDKERIV